MISLDAKSKMIHCRYAALSWFEARFFKEYCVLTSSTPQEIHVQFCSLGSHSLFLLLTIQAYTLFLSCGYRNPNSTSDSHVEFGSMCIHYIHQSQSESESESEFVRYWKVLQMRNVWSSFLWIGKMSLILYVVTWSFYGYQKTPLAENDNFWTLIRILFLLCGLDFISVFS